MGILALDLAKGLGIANKDDLPPEEYFPLRLKSLKRRKGLKFDTDIAMAANIRQSRFSKLMNGLTFPPSTELIKLADFFDVSVDSLIKGKTNDLI